MAIEVGVGYISILPETSKLSSGVKSALKGAERDADRTGKNMGSKMGGGIKAGIGKAVGVAGGLAAAIGITGLISEVATATDSINKFKQTMNFAGLGTKEVNKATKATKAYADATVYGLADVQNMAAQLAANGIPNYLELTEAAGNLNAVAGGSAETFKSVGMVMTQTAGAGKLTTENWNQLADAIPGASGQLQKALKANGAFVGDFRTELAKGEITADEFNAAVVQLGNKPVAVKAASSTKTFEGALGNLQASIVSALIPAMVALQPVVSTVAGWLADKAVPAITSFVTVAADKAKPVLAEIGDLFSAVAGFITDHWEAIKIAVPIVAGFAAGIGIAALATSLWATAQGLLNAALALSPIGLVVGAVVALGVAFVIAYKKSETFRNIVNKAWADIKAAIKIAWDSYIKPALTAFWKFITDVLMPIIVKLWNNVIKPVFKFIGKAIKVAWAIIKVVLKAWHNYMQNVLFPVIRFLWAKIVRPVFNAIKKGIKVAWAIIKVIFNAWKAYFQNVLFPVIRFLWNNVIKPVMAGIGKVISAAWNKVIKPVFKALGDFINDNVKPAFKKGIDAIGKIWDGLKAAARKPVEFLVNTVYNNGIRSMMNLIPGVNLPAASFATGGYTGPGGKYTPAGVVHADEYVINKSSRRKIEKKTPGLLDYMNNYGTMPGYASGGRVWPLPGGRASTYAGHDGVDFNIGSGWDDYGLPYLAAASGTVSYTGSGRGYGNAVFVRGPYGELVYGHSSAVLVRSGQSVFPGQILGRVGNTGNSSAPHLHFGFPGGSYGGAMAFLSGAATTKGVSSKQIAKEEDKKDSWLDLITKLPGKAKSVWNSIKGMASTGWAGEFRKAGPEILRSAAMYGDNKIPDKLKLKYLPDVDLPNTPIMSALSKLGIFDSGGVLMPGQMAYNASNKPEAVFNHRQFKQFAESAGGQRRGPMRMTITNWEDGVGFFEDIASDQIDEEMNYQTTLGRRR